MAPKNGSSDSGGKSAHIPVESLKHQDRRPNIPTEELSDFVKKDETKPGAMLYPRDPSLDPQLVWKGKDEQDRSDLSVPVVPVYIQEKIKPQALIENLRDTARRGEREPEMTLFDDFDGLEFGSNWQVSTRKRDVKDGKLEDATRQPEQIKAFRDTWELGIHSYLTYLRDRLTVARDLLTESGSIFVQIGDENVHLVRQVYRDCGGE